MLALLTPRLSQYNPQDYLQLSTLLKVCALCSRNTWNGGKGRQTHGRGIKADLSKCIMAQVICVYIAAAKFIFYYSRHRINPTDNSFQMCAGIPGVSERHLQGWWRDLQPGSHLSLLPLLFSLREQPFHHSDRGRERGFLTVLLCKYSTFWKSVVFYECRVFGLFLPVRNARRSLSFPSSGVAGGGKEALSCWWALLQTGLVVDFFALISTPFFPAHFLSFGMTFHSHFRSVIVLHFLAVYYFLVPDHFLNQ